MLNELKRTTVDVEEIITKLESISSSLTSKAIELDRIDNEAAEIEEQ